MQCPNCGAANPPGSRFCGECGTPLPAEAAPPPAAPPPPAEPPPTEPVAPVPPPPAAPPPPPPPGTPPPPAFEPTQPVAAVPPVPPVPPTTPPPAPPVGGEPPAPEQRSRRGLLFGLLALLVVAAIVGAFLVLGGGDDDGGEGQIVLEPIGERVADEFIDVDLIRAESSIDVALGNLPSLVGDEIAATLAGRRAAGDQPGLYGGTRDDQVCDVEQLVDFLTDEDNADKAEAWAEVHDIDVDEIEDFIGGLTAVQLRFDTRVTNHGFTDGAANGFQSILERGTAVLVDDEGVPRVKCSCGNPLLEPDRLDVDEDDALDVDALAQNPEDAWDDFDPEDVVVVEGGDDVDEFLLVGIEEGDLFLRAVGTNGEDDADIDDLGDLCVEFGDSPTCEEGPPETTTSTTAPPDDTTTTTIVLGTGDVQVTLEWGSDADLDLAVTDPTGETVDFITTSVSSGGQLDVDSNVGCDNDGSIENVFWPPGGAPAGSYTVEVTGFTVESCSQGPQSGAYTLTIRVAGQPDQVIEDTVSDGETDSFNFVV